MQGNLIALSSWARWLFGEREAITESKDPYSPRNDAKSPRGILTTTPTGPETPRRSAANRDPSIALSYASCTTTPRRMTGAQT